MRRLRHHVNPLGRPYLTSRAAPLGPLPGDVEVELGCADARFLLERAPTRPEASFVGIEIREPLVRQVNRIARERGLANLQIVFANINTELDGLFAAESLARVYVNFPDPWFKRRHHKRRLLTPELARTLHRQLRPGGELFFQSDVFDLALDAMAVLEADPSAFHNLDGPWSFARHNPYVARSLREVRCEERQVRIWRIRYRRAG